MNAEGRVSAEGRRIASTSSTIASTFTTTSHLSRQSTCRTGPPFRRCLQGAEEVQVSPEVTAGFLIAELGTALEAVDTKLDLARDVTVGEVGLLLEAAAWKCLNVSK